MPIAVAVCQFAAGTDVPANTERCIELLAAAAAGGAELAVLPELAMHFDPTHSTLGPHGESIDGPFVSAVAQAAKAHGIAALVGMTERLDGHTSDSNTLVALTPEGELAGVYRKIHLYDAFGYRESDTIRAADISAPLLFDVGGVTVSALTCYDLRFPEAFRWVVDAGAEVVALPAAWAAGPAKEDHWSTLLRARAIENTIYIAGAGQVGPVSCAQSMIVDPMGVVAACAGEAPGVAIAPVDPARVADVRRVNPSLANRRFTVTPR